MSSHVGKRQCVGRKAIRGERKVTTTVGVTPEVKEYLDQHEKSQSELESGSKAMSNNDAPLPEKISFRPGPLAGPMGIKIQATGETPSEYLRRLVAEDCDTTPPKMTAGNPNFGKPNYDSSTR